MTTPDPQPPLTVLVAEDDETTALLLVHLLRREGFDVTVVSDGRAAAERIQAGPSTDLVLLDMNLPYLDGFELIRQIRQDQAWAGVPVVVITARSLEKDIVRALDAGADDYLVKPFKPEELLARIRGRMRRRG